MATSGLSWIPKLMFENTKRNNNISAIKKLSINNVMTTLKFIQFSTSAFKHAMNNMWVSAPDKSLF